MLKPYVFQQEAIDKFVKNYYELGVTNVLLGDDMGLGKTVTAIELDKERRKCTLTGQAKAWLAPGLTSGTKPPTLVVTLKSMLGTWTDHFKDWNPSLKVCVMDTKKRREFITSLQERRADVYICHWEGMRIEAEHLHKVRWLHKIGDEVHKIKNRKAQVTQAYKKIHAIFKTDMSGTWADNRPDDAWSILNHLYKQTWPSYQHFYDHHVINVTHNQGVCEADDCGGYHQRGFKTIQGVRHTEELHKQLNAFYVRRTKEQVLNDLPDKYYSEVYVDLAPQQLRAYNEMRDEMLSWVGENRDQPLAAPVAIAKLVRLKQFAVAYGELEPRKVKMVDESTGEVYYVMKDFLRLTDPSAKLDALMERLEATRSDASQVVFSNSRQIIEMLGVRLEKAGISHRLLTGSVNNDKTRADIVRDFQAGKYQVFAGTIKAGGVGITLTRASTIHLLDRHPSPSANKQAIDRLHRIGQKNAVHVIDYIAKGTIDKATLEGIALKWEWLLKVLGDK